MKTAPVTLPNLRSRWSLLAAVVGLMLLACARLACIDGLARRATIDGPSMAPALCGAAYQVLCDDCGFRFPCDADHVPDDRLALCPNCGYAQNALASATRTPPDRVLIDRWPLFFRRPRRGEVVALRSQDGDFVVKRIAGLPGENLAIQNGELYDDGKLLRKSLSQLHDLWLPVHDNAHPPQKTTGLAPRWRPTRDDSKWLPRAAAFQIAPSASASTIDWLEYQSRSFTFDSRQRDAASPTLDDDSFNQGEAHRPLNVVRDLILACTLRQTAPGTLAFAFDDGHHRFTAEIVAGGRLKLTTGGQTVLDRPCKIDLARRPVKIQFGSFDQQLVLAFDGRIALLHACDPLPGDASPPLSPLAIGAGGGGLEVSDLRVWRDVYYLDPSGLSRSWRAGSPLAPRAFALLGDNQPVSIDSRHWQPTGVPRRSIVGLVYRPFWTRPR